MPESVALKELLQLAIQDIRHLTDIEPPLLSVLNTNGRREDPAGRAPVKPRHFS
jgi:hypothetical protein